MIYLRKGRRIKEEPLSKEKNKEINEESKKSKRRIIKRKDVASF